MKLFRRASLTILSAAMGISLGMTAVKAEETSAADIQAVSQVEWAGNIPGFGTYPQRTLTEVTLTYADEVTEDLSTSDFTLVDNAYAEDESSNYGNVKILDLKKDGNKVILSVISDTQAGILAGEGGNFRRYKYEFTVNQLKETAGTEPQSYTFNQEAVTNIASDEFKDLILDSENSDNQIYAKLYLPEGYDSAKKYPMVIHCTGGSQQYRTDTPDEEVYGKDNYGVELDIDLTPKTFSLNAPEPTIFVTVQALLRDAPEGYSAGADFVQLTKYVMENYAVDPDRVYAIGNSQGGLHMTNAVALAPELFAAYLPCNTSFTMATIEADDRESDDYKAIKNICDIYAENRVAIGFNVGRNDFTGAFLRDEPTFAILQESYPEDAQDRLKMWIYEDEDFKAVGSTYYHGATGLMCLNEEAKAWLYAQTNEADVESEVTVTGEEAMELAEVPAAVRDIINVEDTTVAISGSEAWTDLYVGTPGNLELPDNNYVTGWSYYNMMELTSWVKQLEKALEGTEVKSIHYKGTDTVIDKAYLDDLNVLLDKLNSFDRSLKIRYDFEKTTNNYIAENGTAQLKFHVQTNGYWGYDLAGDSIIDKVTGEKGGYMENQQLNNKYANFFVVDMTEKFENMYVLNDTDLQNPVLYMNDTEAFLVDVDFRGGETLHKLVMDMVGDRDLYIYITHAHGDHYNNLEFFEAEDMKGLYFGKNEALPRAEWFAKFNDLVIPFEDGMKIERAGKEFEVIEMNNHTSGGSQLLDITDRILLSGDTIGAQTFKGGTTVGLSAVDNWIAQFDHSIEVLKLGTDERRCDYIIGGHTAYLNTWEFEMWVYQALLEAQEKGPSATTLNPIGQNTIVVKDGRVLSPEENLACFLNGTPVPAISDEEVMHTASINLRNDSIVTKDEKYPNVYHYTSKRVTDEYSENFYNAAYIIYADGALNEAKASKLLKDLGADANMNKYGWNALVVAPLAEEYSAEDLKLYTDTLIDMSGSMFGIKIIGIGSGADFVNEFITSKDFAVSGYLTIDAENEGEYGDIPAYVTSTEKESLAEAFENGWKEALSKTMKLGNIGGTFYTMPASLERPYEFTPWTESEALGFTRNVVKEDLDGDGIDSLWYEYIPETASKENGSAPMVLLLHGNGNDPRTQFETSGWAQLAAKEGIILIEPEWQGTSWGADPMTENDSTTKENDIITMLEKVFAKYPQIDRSRVYAEGLSRGSLNTMDLLLTHPEIFAGGGSHSGAVIGDLMSADDFTDIIKEEKDQYDMPWFFIAGTQDGFVPVSEKGAEKSGVLQALNLFEELNEMGHTEYADLDESKVEWFGFTQMKDFGEVENAGSLTVKGGTIKNSAGIPMLSFNAIENWGHWNYPASAELMWNFLKHYSRDTETGALNYDGLTISRTEAEIPTRTTLKLSATKPVTWTSSDESIAAADENGLVTALRYGKVTITATAEDGETATCEVQTRYYDVNDDSKYYWTPVYWAADNAITKGYDNVFFGPERNCTREAVVTFLWRLAGKPEPQTTTNPFSDVSANKYYYKAVLWAAENGITKGYKDGTFRPDETCLREHVVTFLYRFAGSPDVKTTVNPFNDVKRSDYYYRASVWANQEGIAKGYSEGEHAGGFGPKLDCLREHVVTFLYRFDTK